MTFSTATIHFWFVACTPPIGSIDRSIDRSMDRAVRKICANKIDELRDLACTRPSGVILRKFPVNDEGKLIERRDS